MRLFTIPVTVWLWLGLIAWTACGGCEDPASPRLRPDAADAGTDSGADIAGDLNNQNINNQQPAEVAVVELPLVGDAAGALAEYSSLAWFGDTLILVPQFPSRLGDALVALEKSRILAYLDGAPAATLTWARVPFDDGGLSRQIPSFEGFEAIGFSGGTVYMTIEAGSTAGTTCTVVKGTVTTDPGLSITLDPQSLREIPQAVQLDNMGHEALLVLEDRVVTLYEANGANVNPSPVVQTFDLQLSPLEAVPMASLEYRLTDVTTVDASGTFWALNYFYPGEADLLDPAPDPLVVQFGEGPTHAASEVVERLVELAFSPSGVTHTGAAPVQLRLMPGEARNWEGLVRLDDRGFLVVTDKFPTTILAFVPFPAR
ncbi:MAG: hypothetical protein CVU59_11725 [Deltaproteobacteria bacterium HGW-Deltaproteobacteria-17]|nr:MAG: hypothetical protein CVU59_11725 [Deltaproteobacteria bacterium HGW-Deltaproteobacteria-17]